VRRVYYGVLGVFAIWGCTALHLARPLTLIIIAANVGDGSFAAMSIWKALV
jgi:hypothetical protein